MAVDPKLVEALKRADAAGDTSAAQAIAAKIRQQRDMVAEPSAAPKRETDTPKNPPAFGGVTDQKRSLFDRVVRGAPAGAYGLIETAAQLVSGAGSAPVSGLLGMGAAFYPGGRSGPEMVEHVQNKLTYQPKTAEGKLASEIVAKPFEALDSLAGDIAYEAGEPTDVLGATLAKTAMLGGLPAAFGIKSRAVSSSPRPTASSRKPPTTQELKSQARQAYKAADDAGVAIKKDSFSKTVEDIRQAMADEGIDATLHPDSMAALNRLLADADKHLTLKGAEIHRKIINDAASSIKPADSRLAGIMRDKLDDFIDSLGNKDVLMGDPKVGSAALREARDLWKRGRKTELIQKVIDDAELSKSGYSASGYENALRAGFRALAKNQKKMRQFSSAERAAIRKITTGGPLENALRQLGKFAPTGFFSMTVGPAAGAAALGPLGAAAVPAIGMASRIGATKLTARNARLAEEMTRRGGPPPKPEPTLTLPNKKALALAAELAKEGQQ